MAEIDGDTLVNALKKRIPGYGAYLEQEARRSDDRLTRELLTRRLAQTMNSLDSKGAKAVGEGDFDAPLILEKLRERIDLARSRLAAAVEGYASWFGERVVDAELLKQVATLDANLVGLVDQMDDLVGKLDVKTKGATQELQEAVELLHSRIDRRHALLKSGL